jgi:hypothetical protein
MVWILLGVALFWATLTLLSILKEDTLSYKTLILASLFTVFGMWSFLLSVSH